MTDLSPSDFDAYFEAIHGSSPFPWQRRLLEQVSRQGHWPPLLDLPTGAGKTAAIDIALFHLALDAARSPAERKAPLRIVMVVDRRTVVDQAHERAAKIRAALLNAKDGVLVTVAKRLQSLSGEEEPLVLAQLRGGMPREDAWARRPDQPVVAVSTVDQVGSRLLFRGYGISDTMRPIHAGLLGNDALILLDEVHLSRPFLETLEAVRKYRSGESEVGPRLPDRWQLVAMSATPGAAARKPFELDGDDRRNASLARRLAAQKPSDLDEIKVSGNDATRHATFGRACAERAIAFANPGRVVGVVVNRVTAARETFAVLRERLGEKAQVFLVTGRMRPLDRDDLNKELQPLIGSDRTRKDDARPVIVVATQCIEAGADFDFDALVTECASLDALRQRFGRLNRLGKVEDARGVVLVRSDSLGKDDDPIYGAALAATWQWLREQGSVDFGIDALKLPDSDELAKLLAPSTRAPVLLPAHLDAWVQTYPQPRPDPDVSLWLHGIDREHSAEVQIVWRADISEALLGHALEDDDAKEAVIARVEACAPVGLEAISIPIHAARAWLQRGDAVELADVEGRVILPKKENEQAAGRPVLLYRRENSQLATVDSMYPGATLVVPSTYGGLTNANWDPASTEPVPDLGDRARWQQTERPALRLHPNLLGRPPAPTLPDSEDSDLDERSAINAWLEGLLDWSGEKWVHAVLSALRRDRRRALVRFGEFPDAKSEEPLAPASLALIGRMRARDTTTEDDSGSHTGVAVELSKHLAGVGDYARDFAERCGLSPELIRDLERAGCWHDAGKADPRFQRMLHDGSEYRASVAPEPLAKSATLASDREKRERARKLSGYPKGARHELMSLALLEAHAPALADSEDGDLIMHLVASHHGFCRPFAPFAPDPEPVDVHFQGNGADIRLSSEHHLDRLDSGIPERFWRLVEKYGWFGLAWLEAILRLADHRRSEREQDAKEEQ